MLSQGFDGSVSLCVPDSLRYGLIHRHAIQYAVILYPGSANRVARPNNRGGFSWS